MYDPLKQKNYVYSGKLGTLIAEFIAEKRAFGYLYNTEAKKLSEFSRITLNYDFPDNTLTQEVVESWLTRRSTDADKTYYSRFSVIKCFADYKDYSSGFKFSFPETGNREGKKGKKNMSCYLRVH